MIMLIFIKQQLKTINYSTEIETKAQSVFNKLLFSYFLLNNFNNLLFCVKFASFGLSLLNFISFLFRIWGVNFSFNNFFIIFVYFQCSFLNIRLMIFIYQFVNIDADISLSTLALKKILAYLCFVFIVFLHKIHISMILSAYCPKMALPHLVQFAYSFSLHEWFAKLELSVSECTSQLFFALSSVWTHSCLKMSSFISLVNTLSFVWTILCQNIVIYECSCEIVFFLTLRTLGIQYLFGDQAQRINHLIGTNFLLVLAAMNLKFKSLFFFLCHSYYYN